MHKNFLLAALDQAFLGRGRCAPNPSVGAVAVCDGTIIAQAWHRGAGTPHAEQLIIDQLPPNLGGVTLYVTLEPCNHWGKTPPCVDAIVRYGFKKVVYAFRDPNPIIEANHTPEILKEHGIDCLHHPLPEIDAFYESYQYWLRTKKPWVTVKIAQSMDGKIAGSQDERIMLSNDLCAGFTHQKRLESDVILTTAKTVNADDPLLNARTSAGDESKPIAIIDAKGRLKPDAQVFHTASCCHIYYDENYPPTSTYPKSKLHPMPATNGLLDLDAIITHLGQLGYHDVWVEAGGSLFTALHVSRLVNRTHIYIVPTVLGPEAVTAYQDPDILNAQRMVSWQAMGDNMIVTFDWSIKECLPE